MKILHLCKDTLNSYSQDLIRKHFDIIKFNYDYDLDPELQLWLMLILSKSNNLKPNCVHD